MPSFALEQSLSKLATNAWQAEEAADAEDLNFVRVARGNRVNTLTMTANENEELKMTLDLNTRAVTDIPQDLASPSTGYEARGGQYTDTSLYLIILVKQHTLNHSFSLMEQLVFMGNNS